MAATPRLPLLKRIPPGVWTAVIWCAATVYPVVDYVVFPTAHEYSYAYPRHGLDSYAARALLALATVLVLAGSALLRRGPRPAYALVLAGTVLLAPAWKQTEIVGIQFLAVSVALAVLTAAEPRRVSLSAAAATLGVLAGFLLPRMLFGVGRDDGTPSEPFMALVVVIAWLVGHQVRQSRVHAERLRAQAAAQAVTAERLRIARELHDMVAHTIGIVALQAGAARRVIDTRPELAREALGEVENASRETLAGLRRMLGALRRAEPGQDPEETPLDPSPFPAPGLDDIDRLAERTTAAGVHVEVRWQGERHTLPPEIGMSAYRIVQEAVTNVVRHAGTRSCQVTVDCRGEELAIEVVDSGNGPGLAAATGYGLLGMRERVGLLHGEFEAAPRPEGGFRVAARLPVPAGVR
ncbi:sensor histidine kinase [Streptomyces sp. NPDC050988]|uniref:sensor histidine kinase n=1 Tax=Streptomyces sp. NPDC050988 TaxID=3365637 RepID=UPI0037AA15AD